jgi:hypothetical protein
MVPFRASCRAGRVSDRSHTDSGGEGGRLPHPFAEEEVYEPGGCEGGLGEK